MFTKIKNIVLNDCHIVPINRCLLLKLNSQKQLSFDIWEGNPFNPEELLILEANRDKFWGDSVRAYPNAHDAGFSIFNGAPLTLGKVVQCESSNKLVVGRIPQELYEFNIQLQKDYYSWYKVIVIIALLMALIGQLFIIRSIQAYNSQINAATEYQKNNRHQDAFEALDKASDIKSGLVLSPFIISDQENRQLVTRKYISGLYNLAAQHQSLSGSPFAFLPNLKNNPDSVAIKFLYRQFFDLNKAMNILFRKGIFQNIEAKKAVEEVKELENHLQFDEVSNLKMDSLDLKSLSKGIRTRMEFIRELTNLRYQIDKRIQPGEDIRKICGLIDKGMDINSPDIHEHKNEFVELLKELKKTVASTKDSRSSPERIEVLLKKLSAF